MNLIYKKMTPASKELGIVRALYEKSFPPDEIPPFEMLIGWERATLFAIYDDDRFVALADTVERKTLVYLFFLAVEEKEQNKGYGSKILSDLKERYKGKTLFLLAEEHNEEEPNYEERLRRFAFYEKNGFRTQNERILDFGVWYEILYTDQVVTKWQFDASMRYLLGYAKE